MNLDNRLFYRLVKVAYALSIPAYFILILTIFVQYRQELITAGVKVSEFSVWIAQPHQLQTMYGFILFFPIYFSLVYLTRQTLIYIAFGRKFEWTWPGVTAFCLSSVIVLLVIAGSLIPSNNDATKPHSKITREH